MNDHKVRILFKLEPNAQVISDENLINEILDKSIQVDGTNNKKFFAKIVNKSNQRIYVNAIIIDGIQFDTKTNNLKAHWVNEWVPSGTLERNSKLIKSELNKIINVVNENPYSYRHEYGYEKDTTISEWFTFFEFENNLNYLIGAVTTEKQFTQINSIKIKEKIVVSLISQCDSVYLDPGDELTSEKFIFLTSKDLELIKREFAQEIKNEIGKEVKDINLNGVNCAYYFQGNIVNQDYIVKTLDNIHNYKFNALQIDAGYSKWGDWLEVKENFPEGFETITKNIANKGLMPGIWISPIIAQLDSELFKNHPDWFIDTENGKTTSLKVTKFDNLVNLFPVAILDITKDEVIEYLKDVFNKLCLQGFKIFKIDFIYPFCFYNKFEKNITRVQAVTNLFRIIKETISDDSIIITALSPLSLNVKYSDVVRVGGDTAQPYFNSIPPLKYLINNYFIKKNILSYVNRNFFNNVIWKADPDCTLMNKKYLIKKKLLNQYDEVTKESTIKWIGDRIF
jgi:hypothetical protein